MTALSQQETTRLQGTGQTAWQTWNTNDKKDPQKKHRLGTVKIFFTGLILNLIFTWNVWTPELCNMFILNIHLSTWWLANMWTMADHVDPIRLLWAVWYGYYLFLTVLSVQMLRLNYMKLIGVTYFHHLFSTIALKEISS